MHLLVVSWVLYGVELELQRVVLRVWVKEEEVYQVQVLDLDGVVWRLVLRITWDRQLGGHNSEARELSSPPHCITKRLFV